MKLRGSRAAIHCIILIILGCFSSCESCGSCDCYDSEPEPEPEPSAGGGCGFECGFSDLDGYDYREDPHYDYHEGEDLLTDESELDDPEGEQVAEVCNGLDDDRNGVIDDVAGTPRCGDGCCNGRESLETCPGDCTCEAPSVPVLLSPLMAEKTKSQAPTFTWLPSYGNCGEATYDLNVDDSCSMPGFEGCLFADPEVTATGIHVTGFTPETDLPLSDAVPHLRRYFWRLRSCYGSLVCSPWSGVRYADIGRTESDLDGNKSTDLAVGVEDAYGRDPGWGRVFIFYVTGEGLSETPSLAVGDPAGAPGENFAVAVSASGDLNGDGFSDLAVGAESQDGEAADEGACFIFYGSEAGIRPESAVVLQNPDHKQWSGFASALDASGDLNGDGLSDLVVGARLMSGLERSEGFVYIYHGSESGVPEIPDAVLANPEHGTSGQFGLSLSSGGDLNGDGIGDLVIGAPYQDGDVEDEGKVYVYYGSAEGVHQEPSLVLENPSASPGSFGVSVASDGDIDADGCADLIIGASVQDGAAEQEGAAVCFHGGSSGLAADDPSYLENPENDNVWAFGSSVGFVGDVNGDGFDDAAVGAPGLLGERGKLFIFAGGEEGFPSSPEITITGPVRWFGYDTIRVGDANRDGAGDFVVIGYLDSGIKGAFAYYGADYRCTLNLP